MQALLILDMLNDFVQSGAPLEVPGAAASVPKIQRRIEEARAMNIPVVYVNDAHEAQDAEFKIWPPHAVKGSSGAEVFEDIAPLRGEVVIEKTSHSGFFRTDLEERLQSMGGTEVTITGAVSNICVLDTAVDALMPGLEAEVLEDCVAALNSDDHRFAIKQIKQVLNPSQS